MVSHARAVVSGMVSAGVAGFLYIALAVALRLHPKLHCVVFAQLPFPTAWLVPASWSFHSRQQLLLQTFDCGLHGTWAQLLLVTRSAKVLLCNFCAFRF